MRVRGSGRVAAGAGAVGLLAGFVALGMTLDASAGHSGGEAATSGAAPSPAPVVATATTSPAAGSIGDLVQAALRRAAAESSESPGDDEADVRAPCVSTVVACVQISTQHVWLIRDGRVTRDGFVSSGATDMRTPTGMFRVQYKDIDHYSRAYDTPMPYSVFFDMNGDALHEGSLALQSAGCVHLSHDDARAFYNTLRPGDGVQILP